MLGYNMAFGQSIGRCIRFVLELARMYGLPHAPTPVILCVLYWTIHEAGHGNYEQNISILWLYDWAWLLDGGS